MSYSRSLGLRVAGVFVSLATWLGLIVFALDNLDTGLPDSEGLYGGWPFWLAALAAVILVALFMRRSPGRPGWGAFVVGLLIPEVAFVVNRVVFTEISWLFWVVLAALVLVPLPKKSPTS